MLGFILKANNSFHGDILPNRTQVKKEVENTENVTSHLWSLFYVSVMDHLS